MGKHDYHFLIECDIYPFTHTTRRQKFIDKRFAKYQHAKTHISWQVQQRMNQMDWEMLPKVPLRLAIILNTGKALHRRDLSNQLKTVEDAIQHFAFQNDAWIDEIVTCRARVPDLPHDRDRALVVISPITDCPLLRWTGQWVVRLADEHELDHQLVYK